MLWYRSDGRLCVGYQSGFTIYSLLGDNHPLSLVHPDNQVCTLTTIIHCYFILRQSTLYVCKQVLGFLAYNPVDALGAVELGKDEFLLVFNTLGVYVDVHGMKSRDKVC